MSKPWYTSKLNWLGIATLLVGIAELVGNSGMLTPEISGGILAAVGTATIVLRAITSTQVTL